MRAWLLAVLATGCLSAPPGPASGDPSRPDGGSGGTGDAGGGAGEDGGAGCVPGSRLDLAWVSEVGVDQLAEEVVTLSGIAVLINPGQDPIAVDPLLAFPAEDSGILGEFHMEGGEVTIPPGAAIGALSTEAAAIVLQEVSEEWSDLAEPTLEVDLSFAGSPVDASLPLKVVAGGYRFEVEVRVVDDSGTPLIDWAREADRASAFCQ